MAANRRQYVSFAEYRTRIEEASSTSLRNRKTRLLLKDLSKHTALALKTKHRRQLQIVRRRLAISMNRLQRELIE